MSKVRLTRNKQLRLSPFTLTPTPPPQHQPNPIRSGKSHSRSTNFQAFLQSQLSHSTDFKSGKYKIKSFPLSENPDFRLYFGVEVRSRESQSQTPNKILIPGRLTFKLYSHSFHTIQTSNQANIKQGASPYPKVQILGYILV